MCADAGTYTIEARNEFGSAHVFTTVRVRERVCPWDLRGTEELLDELERKRTRKPLRHVPGRLPEAPRVTEVGKSWVSLSWLKPDRNGGAPVTAYKVEACAADVEDKTWKEVGLSPVSQYEAFNLEPDRDYLFRITARNKYGWGEPVTTVSPVRLGHRSRLPEFVRILPGHLRLLKGWTLKLQCQVKGNPPPVVAWFRDGMPLSKHDGDRFHFEHDDGIYSLMVRDVQVSDHGKYMCQAQNDGGRVTTHSVVSVVQDPTLLDHVNVRDPIYSRILRTVDEEASAPKFSLRLRDRRVQVSHPVRLTCQVHSNPESLVQWLRDGQLLRESEHIVCTREGNFATLEIPVATYNDVGVYTARACNKHGATACHARLTVDSGLHEHKCPRFSSAFTDANLPEGGTLVLEATIDAYPAAGVCWCKDGKRLRCSRRHRMRLEKDGFLSLSITPLLPQDAGVYTATVSNCMGRTSQCFRLTVTSPEMDSSSDYLPLNGEAKAPEFLVKPRSSEVFEGDTVVIHCEVIGNPKPVVFWHRDFLNPDYYLNAEHFIRVGTGPTYHLKVPCTTFDDTGTYSVIARNPLGEARAVISLQVYARGQGKEGEADAPKVKMSEVEKAPQVLEPLRDLYCGDGDEASFECRVTGDPPPTIVWTKDGKQGGKSLPLRVGEMTETIRLKAFACAASVPPPFTQIIKNCHGFRYEVDDEVVRLRIREIYPEDAGLFECQALNNLGKVSTQARLHVNSSTGDEGRVSGKRKIMPPKFYSVPHNKIVEEGDSATFYCSVAGYPVPTVTWDKDNVSIKEGDPKYHMKTRKDLRVLEVCHVCRDDAGLYRVTISNNFGRCQASARLDVICESTSRKSLDLPPGKYILALGLGLRCDCRIWEHLDIPYHRNSLAGTVTPASGVEERHTSPVISAVPLFQELTGTDLQFSNACSMNVCMQQALDLGIPSQDQMNVMRKRLHGECLMGEWRSQNGVPLEDSENIVTSFDGLTARLTLRGVSDEDAGAITCKAFSADGEAECSASLTVVDLPRRGGIDKKLSVPKTVESLDKMASNGPISLTGAPPEFMQRLVDLLVPNGAPVLLTVHDHRKEMEMIEFIHQFDQLGTPPVEVIWVKNDEEIVPCGDLQYLSDGKGKFSLFIPDPVPEDSGIYFCEAYNAFGEAETFCNLTVANGMQLQSSIWKGNLYLRSQEERHAVNFSFCAERKLERGEMPMILDFPESLVVAEGGNILIEIQAKGVPRPTVHWLLNGQLITPSSKNQIQRDGCIHRLYVNEASCMDAGEIHLIAQNRHGTVSHSCKLVLLNKKNARQPPLEPDQAWTNVEDVNVMSLNNESRQEIETGGNLPASIASGPQSVTVLRGEGVTLQAHVVGDPPPLVTWFKGGREIVSNGRVDIDTFNEVSTLSIQHVTSDDSGKYLVMVDNGIGSDCRHASVAVEGAPDPPAGRATGAVSGEDSITLAWYGSAYDGGSIITGYIVEMKDVQDPGQTWVVACHKCNSTSYVVKGLMPGGEYVFRIRALNVHGVSAPSAESQPLKLDWRKAQRKISEDMEAEIAQPFEHRIIQLEPGEEFAERYEVEEEVGRGRFGTVYKVTEKTTRKKFAAKFIKCLKLRDKSKVHEEIDIMNMLEHPKLLMLAAAFEKPREIVMVMEYIGGGELFERVVADDFTLTERDCVRFMKQICDSVGYMHKCSIVHLDLKPENILCQSRTSHHIKIIDFGLAKRLCPDETVRVMFGTPEFIAPEVISYEPITLACDMWSVGVICYVLLSGLSPFMGDNDAETFANITRAVVDFEDEAFTYISQDAKDFITSLLVKRPDKRLTATECLQHQWLAQCENKLKSVKLSTDKLKKFIIRRKWQKTGKAILALGRMAHLRRASESRRGSSTSPLSSVVEESSSGRSTPVQERPDTPTEDLPSRKSFQRSQPICITDTSLYNPVLHSPVDLEETGVCSKTRSPSIYSERSDSGFSECSLPSLKSRTSIRRETSILETDEDVPDDPSRKDSLDSERQFSLEPPDKAEPFIPNGPFPGPGNDYDTVAGSRGHQLDVQRQKISMSKVAPSIYSSLKHSS
ncbi:unnamed protein product [Darwinula stevensoni]|uniref:Uncharacterized protein n=1 Tax=Darwinula stevensoni TaxID=69355 RepID=A0A7R8X7F4_9CRUS|nr:unnamed protein product [Darwinula stevensoni]CAG0886838.1 unnamed protein product [Darwinula stevensoni]